MKKTAYRGLKDTSYVYMEPQKHPSLHFVWCQEKLESDI